MEHMAIITDFGDQRGMIEIEIGIEIDVTGIE